MPPDRAAAALDQLREAALDVDGATVKDGSAVLELFTRGASKGDAVVRLAAEVASVVTVFVGDDVTDEDAFSSLTAADVSIKVGASDSAARHRLRDTDAVAEWLRRLADKLGPPPADLSPAVPAVPFSSWLSHPHAHDGGMDSIGFVTEEVQRDVDDGDEFLRSLRLRLAATPVRLDDWLHPSTDGVPIEAAPSDLIDEAIGTLCVRSNSW